VIKSSCSLSYQAPLEPASRLDLTCLLESLAGKSQIGKGIAPEFDPMNKGPTGSIANTISSFLPDTMKRVFHPRPYLHRIMAGLIIKNIATDRAASQNEARPAAWVQIKGVCQEVDVPLDLDKPRGLSCYESDYRALKGHTNDGSTPVLDAIKNSAETEKAKRLNDIPTTSTSTTGGMSPDGA
jgi:hypothetical protein